MKRIISFMLCLALILPFTFSAAAVEELYYLPGDVNNDGQVTAIDARTILRLSVDLETWETIAAQCKDAEKYDYKKACDPDGDGKFSATDARLSLRASVGLELIPSPHQTISVALGGEPYTMDPALNSESNASTMITHLFSGLAKYTKDKNGVLTIVADCAKELPEPSVGEDGKATYVFELKENLKWSDGTPLTAADFEYSLNRAADPDIYADYGYLLEAIDGWTEMNAWGYDGLLYPDAKLNVHADGNKLTIVTTTVFPYFYDLLTMNICMPVKKDIVEADKYWSSDADSYVSNGAYTLSQWDHNEKMVLTKNENYHDAASVKLESITFNLCDSTEAILSLYKNGSVQFAEGASSNSFSGVDTSELYTSPSMGTYFYSFNVNKSLLPSENTLEEADKVNAEAEVRNALSLLIDRNDIVDILGFTAESTASSLVPSGITDADASKDFYENAGSSDDYSGYYDTSEDAYGTNCEKAISILKKYYTFDNSTGKFTDFPAIELTLNDGSAHSVIAESIKAAYEKYGITINFRVLSWMELLNARQTGDFSLVRCGWLCDYNDPSNILELWTTHNTNNDARLGKDAHKDVAVYSLDLTPYGIDYKITNGTWSQTYDYLINVIKKTTDKELRYSLQHLAEDLLMETGAIIPLYYYSYYHACKDNVQNWFVTPYGQKIFTYSTIY